jgi:hypothetical protein
MSGGRMIRERDRNHSCLDDDEPITNLRGSSATFFSLGYTGLKAGISTNDGDR